MSNIYVGTCSWADKSLVNSGEFYPSGISSPEQRLRYYASVFSSVEVDSSFYALPSARNSKLWTERTPNEFIFNLKAFGVMTGHSVKLQSLPEDIIKKTDRDRDERIFINDSGAVREIFRRFVEGILPLADANKLGLVVFQYPPWFEKNIRNFDKIAEMKELMGDIGCAVEFRNKSWLENDGANETLNFLREHNITYVVSDAPQVNSNKTVRYLADVTSDTAYFRFHGRNTENWDKKGVDVSLRYDYEYSKSELEIFARDIKLVRGKVKRVFAMFNNHRGSQAVRNARELMNLLE